jgi:hypothetical protein
LRQFARGTAVEAVLSRVNSFDAANGFIGGAVTEAAIINPGR